jgi:hypothetical protein
VAQPQRKPWGKAISVNCDMGLLSWSACQQQAVFDHSMLGFRRLSTACLGSEMPWRRPAALSARGGLNYPQAGGRAAACGLRRSRTLLSQGDVFDDQQGSHCQQHPAEDGPNGP